MIQKICENPKTGFTWIDVENPSEAELDELSTRYGLPQAAVQDCLDPIHLPKYEAFDDSFFVIVRAVDDHAIPDSDTIHSLSRKIAVFIRGQTLVTAHRKKQKILSDIQSRWKTHPPVTKNESYSLLCEILKRSLISFESTLSLAEQKLSTFEERIFRGTASPLILEDLYFFKQRIMLCRKLIRMNLDVAYEVDEAPGKIASLIQDVKEEGGRVAGFTDELIENMHNLFNIQISLSSHRTNEIVRVLTLFSVFFMPLTFIVGVYGMNFRHMPELEWRYGYAAVLLLMALVSSGIYLWFRRKGWLR